MQLRKVARVIEAGYMGRGLASRVNIPVDKAMSIGVYEEQVERAVWEAGRAIVHGRRPRVLLLGGGL